MAKDRNTFAKRQREMDRQRKADLKRVRRAEKQRANGLSDNKPQPSLSETERSVLVVFRKYLMTPGQMLCLGSADLETLKLAISDLTSNGLLVAEARPGGYSLTDRGYAAMKECE